MSDFDRTGSVEVERPAPGPPPEYLHLVVAWSADQPELVGHAAGVTAPSLLGRGRPSPEDPAPRLMFKAMRPSGNTSGPPLSGVQLSRSQLLLEPAVGGALAVRSIGRHPLFHNGQQVTDAVARPGDTLRILQTLVLFVVSRPTWLDAHPGSPDFPLPFGAPDAHSIVGESAAMWKLRAALRFAAEGRQHVLVQGESGSGKELVARAIHALSTRSRGPFIARNAPTLPEGLVDAELFGSVRGYPHAQSPERLGLIGEADGGTLFLDEVAELAHDLQAHLLRVLDHGGEYQRLGDARTRRADVRLVAATNRPVEALKHDLAARFALRIDVPGLNDRREDIPFLLRQLLATAIREHAGLKRLYGKLANEPPRLDTLLAPELVEALLLHRYTTHVRELNQLLWTALSTGRPGLITLTSQVRADLQRAKDAAPVASGKGFTSTVAMFVSRKDDVVSLVATAPPVSPVPPVPPDQIERHHIEAALAQTGGKITPASRLLGLTSRHVLRRLMKRFGMVAEKEEAAEPDE